MALLTLTSDIGEQDYLAGAVKAVLLRQDSTFQLLDITHQLSPNNDPQAAYIIRNATKQFPQGTFHIVLVNLFQYKPEHLLMVRHNDQYFCMADNGLITMILKKHRTK